MSLTSEYHRFHADFGNLDFGHEVDIGIGYSTPLKGLSTKLEYADYRAGDTATGKLDTRKLWVTAVYGF